MGLPILLGTHAAPGRTFVQIAGSGFRIEAKVLKAEFERPSELRRYLQRYIQGFLVQTAQTAACNRLHRIEERLSRWLLACHDRMESDRLPLTHDFLGQMLGAPRTTVTLAAGLLHRAGMIDYTRGVVTIQNRSPHAPLHPGDCPGAVAGATDHRVHPRTGDPCPGVGKRGTGGD